ncbi:MAG: PilZ domain-containing protein [Eubacterium sp.]|jgi:PilZ domain.|nr:PilZ domain-containing protein [Eubacterium sp.]
MERRSGKRLELTVTLNLKCVQDHTEKEILIKVTDLSCTGMGFRSMEKLDVKGYYDTNMVIWTKEVIPCVIQIVRETQEDDGTYRYGAMFIGMSEINQQKIHTYQMIDEIEKEGA